MSNGELFSGISARVAPILAASKAFIRDQIQPVEAEYWQEVARSDRWQFSKRQQEILEGLKAKARAQGLWNLFLPDSEHGAGLSNLEYAHIAEATGHSLLAPEVFNCNAPDTGNMEVLVRYGSDAQKAQWLEPLLKGEIRSAFAMTEPQVASSDATNIETRAELSDGQWVINGEKTYISGAGDPRCRILIVMAVTNPENGPYQRQSQILVPMDSPGLHVLRPMHVFGHDDAPHGHMHLRFENVRVPQSHVILGPGRGFEIAQGRLGPGRIHHCMRAIGTAELALKLMCERATSRVAFGKPLAQLGGNMDVIANARIDIEMARLLTLKAAHAMDTTDNKKARSLISQIKVVAPNVALKVLDAAIQIHGCAGVGQDLPLATLWAHQRSLRLADGPDEVHRRVIARQELKPYINAEIR